MPIHQLDPDVAAKIAAGEVVERPASVVKELVENALDAGARTIRVDIVGGGLDTIRVRDDGTGIQAAELPLAFARHATSKIGTLADLERIGTLGFRGEALASIGSIARVTILTRPRGTDAGAQITAEEGRIGPVRTAGAPEGTSITVQGLFASVPARLKFLKTRATESGHSLRLVEQYALAYPEVRFSATNEGKEVFSTPGDGSLLSAITAVYGLKIAQDMAALGAFDDTANSAAHAAVAPGDDAVRVWGYTSRPTCYKSTRQFLSFFVNRRWIQSRTLTYAAEEAYHSLLLTGRHPVAVVNIALDPALVDVNVHPAKTEVKFLRERQVYAAVQRAVRAAVLNTVETPELSPRAFAAPGFLPDQSTPNAASSATGEPSPSLGQGALFGAPAGDPQLAASQAGNSAGFHVPEPEGPVGGHKLPVLRVLGQVSQSYIITEGPDGMYLVDQHAAHERILLERMVAQWRAQGVSSQLLLEPVLVPCAAGEYEQLEDQLVSLSALGFTIDPFDGAVLVRAVPAALAEQADAEALHDLLLQLAGSRDEAASHGETWEEHALANVACKAAIKAGQSLTPEEQRELIRQLEGADAYQSCCHGRPTMVHLSVSALEREFDRR